MSEPTPQDQDHPRVRASDAERERVADQLRTAVTEGRLSLQEGDERLAALYAMKFRDELPSLTQDLPRDPADEARERRDSQRAPGSGVSGGFGPGGFGPGGFGPGSGPEGRHWGGGPGSRWGGPGGWGGPPWSDPAQEGDDRDRRRGGWDRRHSPWPFRLAPLVMLLIIAGIIVSAVGGHFFWPIIPLFILFVSLTRFARFNACRRGWTR